MRFLLSVLGLSVTALAVLGAFGTACATKAPCDVECGASPNQFVVTFPCGRPAPATLVASGACVLSSGSGPPGGPFLAFADDGTCHLTARFADGTTAEADVVRTPNDSSCCPSPNYSGVVFTDGTFEVQLGGAPCDDASVGSGYVGFGEDAGSTADASDASPE